MNNIITIFNTEDKDELKIGMKNIILKHFKNELDEYGEYFFDKNVIDDLIQEAFVEIIDNLKYELKEIVKEKMLESLNLKSLKKLMK